MNRFQELRQKLRAQRIAGEISQADYDSRLSLINDEERESQPAKFKINPDDGASSEPTIARAIVPPQPTAGMLIGIYKLISKLRGGMGVVWKAEDTKGERLVALKFLPPELLGNADEIARIKSTFKLVEQLNHDHICRVFGLDEHPKFGWFQVMRWIEGETLSSYRRDADDSIRCLSVEEVAKLLAPVAEALDYAHSREVLHRDIKPQNIMRAADGTISVIDFGLAEKSRSSLCDISTGELRLVGTEPYLAPELWNFERPSPMSDQFALGVTAYELLAGRRPFERANSENIVVPSLTGIPPEVMAALKKCLAEKASDRFESCAAFVDALGHRRTSPPPPPPPRTSWLPLLFVLGFALFVIFVVVRDQRPNAGGDVTRHEAPLPQPHTPTVTTPEQPQKPQKPQPDSKPAAEQPAPEKPEAKPDPKQPIPVPRVVDPMPPTPDKPPQPPQPENPLPVKDPVASEPVALKIRKLYEAACRKLDAPTLTEDLLRAVEDHELAAINQAISQDRTGKESNAQKAVWYGYRALLYRRLNRPEDAQLDESTVRNLTKPGG